MRVLYADGIGTGQTGASTEDSFLYKVVERLVMLDEDFRPDRIMWPASMATIGGSLSWNESARIGVQDIDMLVENEPNEPFVLLGYSGGCKVVHDWLDENPDLLHLVAAVGFMSDPFRPKGRKQAELPDTIGWGICGERLGPIPERTFWTTAQADVISDAREDSLLRTAADASDVMPGQFVGDLGRHLKDGDLQLAWQLKAFKTNPLKWLLGLGPRLHQARVDIEGYLGGNHTVAYTTPYAGGGSLAQRLADSIYWHIENSTD